MDSPTWLLTGGAGYIGSHVLRAVQRVGVRVVVLDDLTTGDRGRVPDDVPLIVGSVQDTALVRRVLREQAVSGVVHLAAKKSVEESVARPLHYYRENVNGLLSLLEAMDETGVRRLVFSSSAAVYGTPRGAGAVDEDADTRPESPYGRTKLVGEWMVDDAAAALGLSVVKLRYFNVVGTGDPRLAETGGSNLFPRVLTAVTSGRRPVLFGDDYPTRDGSCVRDYIHVQDLAEAHAAAVELVSAGACHETVNIGCGVGHSVREVLTAMARITGRDTRPEVLPRRAGDPASMVADASRARELLGWTARFDLDDMVGSAWTAMPASAVATSPVPPRPRPRPAAGTAAAPAAPGTAAAAPAAGTDGTAEARAS
jgi:UDP-glucose 4-epimerase